MLWVVVAVAAAVGGSVIAGVSRTTKTRLRMNGRRWLPLYHRGRRRAFENIAGI